MNQHLLDETAAVSRPGCGASAPTSPRSPQERQPRRPAGHGDEPASGVAPSSGAGAPERLSATERRRRSEALAYKLADAPDLGAVVAIVQEHGRPAVSRAAAVRPDLVPEINGEFAHIALSLADLD